MSFEEENVAPARHRPWINMTIEERVDMLSYQQEHVTDELYVLGDHVKDIQHEVSRITSEVSQMKQEVKREIKDLRHQFTELHFEVTDVKRMINRLLVSFESTRLSNYQTARESIGSPGGRTSPNPVRVGSRPSSPAVEQVIPEVRTRLFSDSLPGREINGDHRVLLKPASLPTFDGSPNKAAEWLIDFELAAAANLWRDADRILGLAQVLTKDARKWFVEVYLPGIPRGTTSTWPHFKKAFEDEYLCEGEKERLLDRIRARKHRPDERLLTYFNDMVCLCREYDSNMSETRIIHYLKRNLSHGPKHAVCSAIQHGRSLKNIRAVLKEIQESTDDLEQPRRQQDLPEVRRESSRPRSPPINAKCFNCLGSGHFLTTCPEPKDISRIRKNQDEFRSKRQGRPVQQLTFDQQEELIDSSDGQDVPINVESLELSSNEDPCDSDEALDVNLASISKTKVCPILNGKVNNQQILILVDTGAVPSVMDEPTAKKVGALLKPWPYTPVKMADKSIVYPVGLTMCLVTIGVMNIPVRFCVLKKTNSPVLVGSEFCTQNGVLIDYRSKRVSIRRPNDPTKIVTVPYGNSLEVSLIDSLVNEFDDLFAKDRADVGTIEGVLHSIPTGDHPPIPSKPYKVSFAERQLIDVLLKEMLDGKVITPSSSPWASPAVLVRKKDGHSRFCIDFRKLNSITQDDRYPIPRIEDALDLLEGCTVFTTLDVAAMYWHVKMNPCDQPKTAFIVPQGLFEFTRMPFGLKNAPATCSRVMNDILGGLNNIICFVYFDDILVFAKDQEEHDHRLRQVLERLRASKIKLRRHKCVFATNEIEYLGYRLGLQGITPSEDNVRAVKEYPRPRSIKQVRSFLGLCSHYRKFVPNFAKRAFALQNLLKKDMRFSWDSEKESSFQDLKSALIQSPVLGQFRTEGKLELRTDACDRGLGAVLLQEQDGQMKPIYYLSRSLNPAERNYGITEKECLAIVWSLGRLRTYLLGRQFVIVTDHCGLCWFRSIRDPTGRLGRWSVRLQPYEFTVKYKSGKNHGDADCLSRFPLETTEEEDDDEDENEFPPVNAIDSESSLKSLQSEDAFCLKTLTALHDPFLSNRSKKRLIRKFTIEDGILYRLRNDKAIPVLPKRLIPEILNQFHDEPMSGGHLGQTKTLAKVKLKFFWPGMTQAIKNYCRSCHECQTAKPYFGPAKGKLIPIEIHKQIFGQISLDLMELPISEQGNRYLVVINDQLSKYAVAAPIPVATSANIIKVLYHEWILRFGCPEILITDRGTNLLSTEFQTFIERFNIEHRPSSAYHPRTDGQTERFNAYIGNSLCIYAQKNPQNWDLHVKELLFAYNITPHSSTGKSPFFLIHAMEARLPIENALCLPNGITITDYQSLIDTERDEARENVQTRQQKSKELFDRSRIDANFDVGDLVLLKVPRLSRKNRNKKFIKKFSGPFRIIKKLSPVVYEITNLKGPPITQIVHAERLKTFNERPVIEEDDAELDELGAFFGLTQNSNN